MALITCPHCGKQVSDSVDTCIHCGGQLKERSVPEKGREYAMLTAEEQKNLLNEFRLHDPDFSETERKGKKQAIWYWISIGLVIAGAIPVIVGFLCDIVVCTVVGFVCFGIGGAFGWAAYFYGRSLNKKSLICLKRYQKWLEREKGIHYTAILEEKYRKIYDQIAVD